MSKNLKILLGLIIVLILAVAGGYFFLKIKEQKVLPQERVLEQIQEQQQSQDFVEETKLLSGKITAIDNNVLTVATVIPAKNPTAKQIPTERKVIVDDKTIIKKFTNIPKVVNDKTAFIPIVTQIKIQDLKIGDLIEIIAAEDIKYKEEITPTEIRVL